MATVAWTENQARRTARWHSENAAPAPARIVVVDDRVTADSAHRMMRAGTALLWRGDFPNARQLLKAVDRRLRPGHPADFHAHRAARSARAALLGRLLVLLEPDHSLCLRRAPDVRAACDHAYGAAPGERVCVSLPELLGVLSAHQWHRNGVDVPALHARIHPDYGVFSPVRGEYVDLVARAPLTAGTEAFDIGTGVLAAVLARRGTRVVATDLNPRAVACARANTARLGLADRVRVIEADLWPAGRADLVVCNPPWLPARPNSALELGIYDPGSTVLGRFLDGVTDHLTPSGEAWLVLSDLAEHLGLRTRDELRTRIAAAGLVVIDRLDTAPRHPRAADVRDPLHAARSKEVTSLWRLAATT